MKQPAALSEIPEQPIGFETPAKIMPGHTILNPDAPERWRRYEVTDDSPLGAAYRKERLSSGRHSYSAEDRYGAGQIYRGIYDAVNSPAGSASNFSRVSGAGTEARSSERICIARDLRRRICERMAEDNFHIVEEFCGAGSNASEVVRARLSGFNKATYLIICAALDDLIDAVIALGLHKVSKRA